MGSATGGGAPIVLVEGRSDVAALAALAPMFGITPDDACFVDMRGVSNFRREWLRASAVGPTLGLCDEREAPYVCRVLQDAGLDVPAVADLPDAGCFVCRSDLEDELIRALTPERAARLVVASGDGHALDRFRRMPAWTERDLGAQLRRWAGAGSGRKARYATVWASALTADTAPPPLRALLLRVRAA